MKYLLISFSLFTILLVGCDKSTEESAAPQPKVEPKVSAPSTSEAVPAPEPEPKDAAKAPLKNAEPFVSVAVKGKEITIAGSIKSTLQKKKLLQNLKEAFPDHEISDELEVDYRRIAVGWGNRFASGYVVPYFKRVPEGTFSYKDGVIKLTGEVADQSVFRELVLAAGEMFMGDFTQDIDSSELIVTEK